MLNLERKCFDLASRVAGKVQSERSKPWKVSYANGDTYEGEATGPTPAQSVRHGYGVYSYSSGGRYEGEFVEDRKQGWGSFFFENGDAYEGQWYCDHCHGRGVLVHWAPDQGILVYEEASSGRVSAAAAGASCQRAAGSLAPGRTMACS
ncbi:unnamed protein product [Effrenium voratum]|nr:unnamed protein product [Effrenium voratum]